MKHDIDENIDPKDYNVEQALTYLRNTVFLLPADPIHPTMDEKVIQADACTCIGIIEQALNSKT